MHWRRIRSVARACDGDEWPRGLEGAIDGIVFAWTLKHERPYVRIGNHVFALVDEAAAPERDRVIEISPSRVRLLSRTGLVRELRGSDPAHAALN
jgi:hypothetical protein